MTVLWIELRKLKKTVGESLAVTKTIDEVLKSTSHLGNTFMDNVARADTLALALNGYSTEAIKSAIAQSTLNDVQIKAILSSKGLAGQSLETTTAELAQATATNALAASEGVATTATAGFKNAVKGLGASMKAFALSNPILTAIAAIGVTIYGAVKAYDALTVSLEEQQEKLDNALSAYEDVKSELDSINSELDENKKKISELEAKPKLTYAEKGQLEELRQITEQLELQKEITEWQAGNKQKAAAMETVAYVNTKYNLGDSNVKDVDKLIPDILAENYKNFETATDINVTDAEYLAARYKAMSNELENLVAKKSELFDNDEIFREDVAMAEYDIETYKGFTEELKTEINDMLSSLMEQKANMQDYYDTIKDTPYEDMSTDARKCYDAMQQINASIQTLYYGLGNNRLNSEVTDGIFNTEGIEKTKEQLIEMAQAGALTPAVIASHEKLADAILNSNLIADEGCGLFETLCNEIYALAEAEKEAADSAKEMSESFSKSAMIDSINALSDGFDIIDKIYADVKDKDVFDFANLDTKKFQEAFGELGVEYENFIEKVSESPDDINACQQAFNELVSKYLMASGVLDNLNEENAKVTASMLELMGVSNAQELVDDALLRKKAELITTTDAYKNATDEEKQAMLEEIGTGEALEQIIAQITLQKQLTNANALDTSADINAIFSLAQTAGFGAEALYNLAEARAFLMEAEASGDVDQINEAKEAIRRIVSVEQQKLASFTADLQYTGADTTNKKSGRASSSSEKDLWLEEYKRKLEELKRQLNEGKLMPSPVVIQDV